MARDLRTNTATRISVGPFLDKTDGITPEVALTVTSEKLTFIVDDGGVPTLVLDVAPTASGGANDMVHITGDDAGYYDLELAAANVNYLGRAVLCLNDVATHLPVFHEFKILTAAEYDRKYGTGHTVEDIYTAVVTNAAGTDIAADIIALKTVADTIQADTDLLDDVAGGLADIHTDVGTAITQATAAAADALAAHTAIDAAVGGLLDIHTDVGTAITQATAAAADALAAHTAVDLIHTDVDAILADTGTDGVVLPQAQADKVWGTAARTLTANTNLANLEVDLTKIHGTAITETAGQLAAAFTKLFDVATPVLTCESVNQAQDNATTAEIKTAIEAGGSSLAQIVAAVITNAAGTDIAADIIALKTVADTIQADTDLLDDAVGGLVDVHTDVAAVKAETASIFAAVVTNAAGADIAADIIALKVVADTIQADTDLLDDAAGGIADIHTDVAAVKGDTAAILLDTGTDGVVLPQAQADKVWGTAARVLTANTNLANLEVDLTKIHGTAITETAGQLAAAFTKLFDVATPVLTCESVNQAQDNATVAEIWNSAGALSSLHMDDLMERIYQMINNNMTVVEATGVVSLKNLAGAVEIASGSVASAAGTTTRAGLSWA